jgi:3-oxoacyl-[acyl-carrier-protein] synthase II
MSSSAARRVVVTGLGLVTPLGVGVPKTWAGLCAGQSGTRRISQFDPTDFASQVAGEVPDFNPDDYLDVKEQKKTDRFIQLGIAAADEALAMANLAEKTGLNLEKCGVIVGSGIGGLAEVERTYDILKERGPRRVSPFFIPSMLPNLLAGQISIRHGFMGANICPVTACATGAHAIGQAMQLIQLGELDVALAGGAEASITPLTVAGFAAARALSTGFNETPESASRPFDKTRDGFVIGEGAGVLVLESLEHATARGATILAELTGFGQTADAYHMTLPREDGAGSKRAMTMALQRAGISGADVSYVNAHATSTPAGDVGEARAIAEVTGGKAQISATKSMTGHMLGAAGAAEAAFCVLALRDQIIPPTINLTTQDEAITADCTPNTARKLPLKHVLSNSFGFGGTNASILLSRWEQS